MSTFDPEVMHPRSASPQPRHNSDNPLHAAVRKALRFNHMRPGMLAVAGVAGLTVAGFPLALAGGPPMGVFPAVVDVNSLSAGEGFRLDGIGNGQNFGGVSDAAGDVNGDGIDDIVVTAVTGGKSYVVFGRDTGFPDRFGVESLDGANGFEIRGAQSFSHTRSAGDFNGDGLDDIIVGEAYGPAHIVFGGATPLFRLPQSLEFSTSEMTGSEIVGGFIANGVSELQISEYGLTRGETHGLSITGATGEFSPYDQPEGVGVTFFNVPDNSLSFIVETFDSESPDVDLFVGRDDNGDGEISPDEERCNSGSAGSEERCDISSPEGGSWWAAVINFESSSPGATDDTSVRASAIAPSSGSFSASGPAGPIVDVAPFSVELSWSLDEPADGDVYQGAIELGTGPGSEGNLGIIPVTLNFTGAGRVVQPARGGDTLPPVAFDLANINGTNGIVLSGASLRPSATGAGDINGDGIDDVIVGTYYASRAYAVFGSDSGLPAEVSLDTLNGTNGTVLLGNSPFAAYTTAAVGDVNGDDFDDVSVGSGPIYVVFGRPEFPAAIDMTALNGADGLALVGAGSIATAAGDINGDGLSDMAVANRSGGNSYGSGATHVVFGNASGFPASLDLQALDGVTGITMYGAAYSYSSGSASFAGDINGDQVDDLAIGGSFGGDAYVVFGRQNGFEANVSLDSLDGLNGFKVGGAGEAAKGAGDINADGVDDLMVGRTSVPSRLYAIFGRQAPDADQDGITDSADNCLERPNPQQIDVDGDLIGNACDADFNNDCMVNADDLATMRAVFFSSDDLADLNGDGHVNFIDLAILKQSYLLAPGPSGIEGAACQP